MRRCMHIRVRGVRREGCLGVRAIRRGESGACARYRGTDVARVRTVIAFDSPSGALPRDTRAELAASPLLLQRCASGFCCDEARRAVRSGDDVDCL